MKDIQISILDQMATPTGKSAEDVARDTIAQVKYAEQLGFKRYWFAEHHGTSGLSSSSPEVMMAVSASLTETIHVGSGGILLPQYSPLKVATQLLQLESLFPGRIDGGVGRSPGGVERVRRALANDKEPQLQTYPQKLDTLTRYVQGKDVDGVYATPRTVTAPSIFSLGLGENSAQLAAHHGVGYVYGHFISPDRGKAAHWTYRASFRSMYMAEPKALTAVFVICGADDEHAETLALSQDVWLLRTEKGLNTHIPSLEEARAVPLSSRDHQKIKQNRGRMIIGGPEKVKDSLLLLAEEHQVDELMVLTNIYDEKEKQASYTRLAELFLS
ncbi:LLM class flavin-dependent oxidoreductase [Caldalkalibacillus salinus]|uniref:LLM class flavin-dependent oxidoreductase n=1 Tax=Caldalkalibacillus salinus TaxID=2803787 RepID=UPI003015952D